MWMSFELLTLSPTGFFHKVFVDISGKAPLGVITRLLSLYRTTFPQSTIVVKNEALFMYLEEKEQERQPAQPHQGSQQHGKLVQQPEQQQTEHACRQTKHGEQQRQAAQEEGQGQERELGRHQQQQQQQKETCSRENFTRDDAAWSTSIQRPGPPPRDPGNETSSNKAGAAAPQQACTEARDAAREQQCLQQSPWSAWQAWGRFLALKDEEQGLLLALEPSCELFRPTW
ncbi:hypothetical protein N2152v2_005482 [Parachlorella kessleri]